MGIIGYTSYDYDNLLFLSRSLLVIWYHSRRNFSRPFSHAIRRIHRKGIYVKRNEKWKRFALAHFSYDNPALKGGRDHDQG